MMRMRRWKDRYDGRVASGAMMSQAQGDVLVERSLVASQRLLRCRRSLMMYLQRRPSTIAEWRISGPRFRGRKGGRGVLGGDRRGRGCRVGGRRMEIAGGGGVMFGGVRGLVERIWRRHSHFLPLRAAGIALGLKGERNILVEPRQDWLRIRFQGPAEEVCDLISAAAAGKRDRKMQGKVQWPRLWTFDVAAAAGRSIQSPPMLENQAEPKRKKNG